MTSALHREAAEFMRADYEMTLAMLRRRRCPVDGEPLTYPEADQPEGDHPPIFECPTGHGYWSTDGAQCGWYRDLRDDGREPWQQYGPVRVPGFPVARAVGLPEVDARRAEAMDFFRDQPDTTLARLRRTRCPVDDQPLTAVWPQPEGDAPPIFGCTDGHGYWSTDGHQVGWYASHPAAPQLPRLPWSQGAPIPGFPVAPRPLAEGDVLDSGGRSRRVEALGRDWLVLRDMDSEVVVFVAEAPEHMVRYRRR